MDVSDLSGFCILRCGNSGLRFDSNLIQWFSCGCYGAPLISSTRNLGLGGNFKAGQLKIITYEGTPIILHLSEGATKSHRQCGCRWASLFQVAQ